MHVNMHMIHLFARLYALHSLWASYVDHLKTIFSWFPQIWRFTMKSACCKHEIVIETDPKNCEYLIISGAHRKTEDFDVEDAETFELPADEGAYYGRIHRC